MFSQFRNSCVLQIFDVLQISRFPKFKFLVFQIYRETKNFNFQEFSISRLFSFWRKSENNGQQANWRKLKNQKIEKRQNYLFVWRCLSLPVLLNFSLSCSLVRSLLCRPSLCALSFVALLSVILCSLLAAVAPWVALVGRVRILQKRFATPSCPPCP